MLVYRASAAVALRALVEALQSTRPLDEVLAELLAQVRAFMGADEAYVLLLRGEQLVVAQADGLPDGAIGRSLERGAGLEGTAATLRHTVAASDANRHRRFVDHFARERQPGAFVAVPLLVRGRDSGVLVAARRARGEFAPAALWWLELLAGLAAVVVAQDEAVRFQEMRARQAELLLSLLDVAPDEPGPFLERLATAIERGLTVERADLLLYDPERRELVPAAWLGGSRADAPDLRLPPESDHPAARAYATARAVTRDEPSGGSTAAVPLRVGPDPRGALHVNSGRPGAFGPDELAFLYLLAARVGVLLEHEEVRRRRSDTRAREELVGVISHELKTPVAVIQAYLELLQRRAEREERASDLEVLGHVSVQTTRMLAMIEELLDVQRIDAGVLRLETSSFDLADLASRTAAALQLTTGDHRIAVETPASLAITADARRVEEVLTNLLQNAIKYSPAGGTITVRVEQQEADALIEVIDQGIGIAPEEQARIFDRFYRARGAGERLHQGHHGLGLGLYIARELVERHGGRIGVRSSPSRGSTFWFTLPR